MSRSKPHNQKPAVSLVIVSLGRPDALAKCLKSLEFQTLVNFEILVVGDTPPDGAARYIPFDTPNISAARNLGIRNARAPIIAFCDDDAVPDPPWIERLIAPFYAHNNIGAAGGYTRDADGIHYQWRAQGFDRWGFDTDIPPPDTPFHIYPPTYYVKTAGTNAAFRTDALTGIGGFDEAYHFYLDETDVNRRLTDAGWQTALAPPAEVHHFSAANHLRDHDKIPLSLYEIAASQNHWIRKYGESASALTALRETRTRRLDRLYKKGRLKREGYAALLDSFDQGAEAGAARHSHTPLAPVTFDGLEPVEIQPSRAQITLDYRPYFRDARFGFESASATWRLDCGFGGRFDRSGGRGLSHRRQYFEQQLQGFLKTRFPDTLFP